MTLKVIRRALVLIAVCAWAPLQLAVEVEAQQADRFTAPVPHDATIDAALAVRVPRGAEIRVDGSLGEPVWRSALPFGDLRQEEPEEGHPATEVTTIRVVFDSTTLFVGVEAFDTDPDRIISRILQRDRVMESDGNGGLDFAGDDAIALLIDPFHDHRNAVVFATNPNGAEFDAQIGDEGRDINISWRAVWAVSARRHAEGWTAEFAIPLRTLRSTGGTDGTLGFNVYRSIRRKNEQALWRSWRPESEGFVRVSLAGDLRGVTVAAPRGVGVDVKPYVLAEGSHRGSDVKHGPGSGVDATSAERGTGTTGQMDLGLDLKYEVRPGLVIDGTVNADFAQAEVDDEQVNLTRFDLFLPEKREFFLENSGVFEFGVRGSAEPPPFLLFFSRRIGMSDHGPVPLLGGARLSGRAGRQTVGFLHTVTDRAFGGPRMNQTVARLKRDVGKAGYLGAMLTRVAGPDTTNVAGGVDWSLWPTGSLNIQGMAVRTDNPSQNRETSAYRLGVGYQKSRLGFTGQHLYIEPGVRADLGFVTRTDIRRNDGLLRLTARPRVAGLRRTDLMIVGQYQTRTTGEFQDWVAGPAFSVTWDSGENVTPYLKSGRTRLDEGFALGGRVPVSAGDYESVTLGLMLTTSPARRISGSAHLVRQRVYEGRILPATLATRVVSGTGTRLDLGLTRSDVELPGGRFVSDVASLGVGYAFSTRLSSTLRIQYNTLDQRLTTSARIEYQYRPASDLFIVLQDGRSGGGIPGIPESRAAIVKLTWLSRI